MSESVWWFSFAGGSSFFGYDLKRILASEKEFGSVSSFPNLQNNLSIIGVSYLKVWW